MYITSRTGSQTLCFLRKSWLLHLCNPLHSLHSIKYTLVQAFPCARSLRRLHAQDSCVPHSSSSYPHHFQMKKRFLPVVSFQEKGLIFSPLRSFPTLDIAEPITGQQEEIIMVGSGGMVVRREIDTGEPTILSITFFNLIITNTCWVT